MLVANPAKETLRRGEHGGFTDTRQGLGQLAREGRWKFLAGRDMLIFGRRCGALRSFNG